MEDLQYVGFWSRFWASVVDIIILMMIIYPIFGWICRWIACEEAVAGVGKQSFY
jgi:hypothetical protein